MAAALSFFISRKPHFSQAPPWPLLLASWWEVIVDGLIWFMAGLAFSSIMVLFIGAKERLGFGFIGFPKFQLKLLKAASMRGTAMAHDDSAPD